jgi:hypothetical protein
LNPSSKAWRETLPNGIKKVYDLNWKLNNWLARIFFSQCRSYGWFSDVIEEWEFYIACSHTLVGVYINLWNVEKIFWSDRFSSVGELRFWIALIPNCKSTSFYADYLAYEKWLCKLNSKQM